MNILIDRLPKQVDVDGVLYQIRSDFRTSILFELLMQDDEYTDTEKIVHALELYYPEIPKNIEKAMDACTRFYLCGEEPPEKESSSLQLLKRQNPVYSYEQDAPYIYAAFLTQYQLNLQEIPYLHWWEFSAMFRALNEDLLFSRIMYYRGVDTKGMGKREKRFIKAMKKKYALNTIDTKKEISLEKRNTAMKEYVKMRFKEMGGGEDVS